MINDGIEKDEITIEISKLHEEDDFFIPDYDSGYARNLPRKQPRMTVSTRLVLPLSYVLFSLARSCNDVMGIVIYRI